MKKLLCYILSVGVLFSMTANMACGKTEESGQSLESSSLWESSVSSQENSSLEEREDASSETSSSETSSSETPTVAVEKISVADVVSNIVSGKNYITRFNEGLSTVVAKKYSLSQVETIDFGEIVIAENGKFEFVLGTRTSSEPVTIAFQGDTRPYEAGYRLAYDQDAYIADILQSMDLTITDQIEKDGTKHNELKSTLTTIVDSFESSVKAFESIPAEDIKEVEPEKPAEKITVQSIVDEVFADIDFDADLKESASKLVSTRVATRQLNILYAMDYRLGENGGVTFFVECENKNTNIPLITSYSVSLNTSEIKNFLSFNSNFNETINNLLSSINLNISSEVEESKVENIREILNSYKEKYLSELTKMQSFSKSEITANTLFSPTTLDSTKMEELGITSMNDFAQALLTNKNGTGFDQVTGWTMDDVVATYVTEFGDEGKIDYSSKMNMLIITSQGVYNYELWTIRGVGITTDRYSMLLNGDPNTLLKYVTQTIDFSDDLIVYNENGERKQKTTEAEVVFYADEQYANLATMKTKKNQA